MRGSLHPVRGSEQTEALYAQESQLPLRAKQREMKIANMAVRAEWV